MSFLETEKSEFSSAQELYSFYSQSFSAPYRYTSGDTQYVYEGNTYVREAISRTKPELSRENDAQNLTVYLPRSSPLASRWIAYVPPKTVWLKVFRFHNNDTSQDVKVFWQGKVRAVAFTADNAEFSCQPINMAFNRNGLTYTFSSMCQHQLYGPRCKVDKDQFKEVVKVGAVSGSYIHSPDLGIFPSTSNDVPSGWWTAGFVERQSDGDIRYIINHGEEGNTRIELVQPFFNLQAGELINVYAGCAHNAATCFNKYNNIINYGGPGIYVPERSPFTGKIGSPIV
jgi:uncharacterized phage protein (TIGR02218 family)